MQIDNKVFNQNLVLTQAYCEMQLTNIEKSPAEILRSFNPEYDGKPLYSFVVGQHSPPFYKSAQSAVYPFDEEAKSFYTDLYDLQMASKKLVVGIFEPDKSYAGQILVADIDESIPDGASEAESLGFIDENDCPPVDTWFYMEQLEFTRRLYAWIPEQFVELVNLGIEVNMLNIFNWKDKPYHYNAGNTPKSANIVSSSQYKYEPHEKYNLGTDHLAPIVFALVLVFILLAWFIFRNQ